MKFTFFYEYLYVGKVFSAIKYTFIIRIYLNKQDKNNDAK